MDRGSYPGPRLKRFGAANRGAGSSKLNAHMLAFSVNEFATPIIMSAHPAKTGGFGAAPWKEAQNGVSRR
jgi:hypothetical protein